VKPPHSIQITAVGAYAPSKVITNDEMAELVDTNDEWIKSHTGIAERHIAEKGELTSDLAYKAISTASSLPRQLPISRASLPQPACLQNGWEARALPLM